MPATPYLLISSAKELAPFLPALREAEVIAIDSETTGLDAKNHRLRLLQLAISGQPVLIIDCFSFLPAGQEMLRELLGGTATKVMQNARFDLSFLQQQGLTAAPVFDTMLAAQLLRSSGGPSKASLAAIALHYLGEEVDKSEQVSDWQGDLRSEQLQYAALDADILLRLHQKLSDELNKHDLQEIARIEFACVAAVTDMELTGIRLDLAAWQALTLQTEKELNDALRILHGFTGEPDAQTSLLGNEVVLEQNYDSNPYILQLLRSQGISVEATSRRDLAPYLDHPLVKAVLAYRRASKALSSFLHPFREMIDPRTGRLYPRYWQIGAASGRMSCSDPNIQQIPREASFRACFVAPTDRKLVIADYSQIELRVATEISGDKRMIEAYGEGADLHRLTASLILGIPTGEVTTAQRQAAKAVNFGLIYGMGAAGLQIYAHASYGAEMTLDQARAFRERFFQAYPGIAAWHQRLQALRPTTGKTMTGRKFAFDAETSLSTLANSPVQGTAADILKLALGMLAQRLRGTQTHIIAAVHDEILLETAAGEATAVADLLRSTMEEAGNTILKVVPCVAEAKIVDTWAEK